MTTPKQIVLIHTPTSPALAPLAKTLKPNPSLKLVEWAGTEVEELDQWLGEMGSVPQGFCVGLGDEKWANQISDRLQDFQEARGVCIPKFGVVDRFDNRPASFAARTKVDDLISPTISVEEFLARLELRAFWAQEKKNEDIATQEHLALLAKTEVTLRQREEFLSVCAHDLRSPLGLIQSSMALILNKEKDNSAFGAQNLELLTRAKRQAGQAITLVNDLLDVMALEQGLKPRYELLNLDSLLSEFYRDYSFQAEQKNIRFHYNNPVADWRVLADGDRIRQLLQNLFTNALKFTDPGKNIYLNVTAFQGKRRTDPPYPMLIVGLKDEGRGIPATEIQKIFDRFSQLKDSSRAQGRGLGLTVAKQISTLHDGNLWVESAEGKGSTFFVLFTHVVSRTQKPEQTPTKPRLLIVEPSPSKQDNIVDKSCRDSYELIFARDGVEALTLLFHWLPAAMILTPNLSKLDEVAVSNIAKADPLTSSVPILLALEDGQTLQKKHENLLADGTVVVPLNKQALNAKPAKKKKIA